MQSAAHSIAASPLPHCPSPQVTHPMDLATVLSNVNARLYATPQQYLADVGRIVQVSCACACATVAALLAPSHRAARPPVHCVPHACLTPRLQCSREYWGDNPAGGREISRAAALEDEAAAELAKAVPPGLQAKLEDMARRGGPAPPPASEWAASPGRGDAVPAGLPGDALSCPAPTLRHCSAPHPHLQAC